METDTPAAATARHGNPLDCTCEHAHRSAPNCPSVVPSTGAVDDSDADVAARRERATAVLLTLLDYHGPMPVSRAGPLLSAALGSADVVRETTADALSRGFVSLSGGRVLSRR